jgi:hypothetical protein
MCAWAGPGRRGGSRRPLPSQASWGLGQGLGQGVGGRGEPGMEPGLGLLVFTGSVFPSHFTVWPRSCVRGDWRAWRGVARGLSPHSASRAGSGRESRPPSGQQGQSCAVASPRLSLNGKQHAITLLERPRGCHTPPLWGSRGLDRAEEATSHFILEPVVG